MAVDFSSFVQYLPQEEPKGEQHMPPQNIPLWHRIIFNWVQEMADIQEALKTE